MRYGNNKIHKGDHQSAFEYWTRAAALGDVHAHFELSVMYQHGEVVEKDKKKQKQHLTEAAIGGHPDARHNLALLEGRNGQYDRAGKHFIIAAKLGLEKSLERVKTLYKAGDEAVSKEDFDAVLHGYQATVDAMKSPQRDEAAKLGRELSGA